MPGHSSTSSLLSTPRGWQAAAFGLVAAGLGWTSWFATHGALAPHTRHVLTMALSFDLMVTLPASYYLLVARPRRQRWWTVAAVALLGGLRAAALIAPAALARLIIAGAVEAGLIAVIVGRGRVAWRARGRHDDPLAVLGRMTAASIGIPVVAEIVASELAVFYYGALSWWRRPQVPSGTRAFSVHQRGGGAALLGVLAGMALLETGIVHIVLLHWSPRVAWIVFALDLYGVLWIVASARALVLRPILVDAEKVVLRVSLWWTMVIDRRLVAEVRPFTGPRPARRSTDPLVLTSLSPPSVLLRFREPFVATGMWGRRRTVASIAVPVDDAAAFLRALG